MANIVSEGRQINSGSRDAIGKLGKLIKKPSAMLSPGSVIRYLMYLPLNAIPVVGPGVFLVLQGESRLSLVPVVLTTRKNFFFGLGSDVWRGQASGRGHRTIIATSS
jgi:hypothetical protein